jgi:hypothetical protein
MKEYKVIIPEEKYTIVEYKQENLPAIMVMNVSLLKFEPKEAFSWNLSILIQFNELNNNGMPAKEETDLIIPFEECIDVQLKGTDKNKPNSLFLARITWNGTRELIYRVYDPENVNNYLQKIIKNKNYPREFDFRMEYDEKWKLNEWFLELIKE